MDQQLLRISVVPLVKFRLLAAFVLCAAGTMGLSCRDGPVPAAQVRSTVVADVGHDAKQVAWVGASLIVQRYDNSVDIGSGWTSRLFAVPVGGGNLRELPIPYDGRCRADGRFAFESPVRAEGNLMMYVQRCADLLPDGTPSLGQVGSLLLFDVAAGQPIKNFNGQQVKAGLRQPIIDTETDGIALDITNNRAWMRVPPVAKAGVVELNELTVGRGLQAPSLPFVQVWGLAPSPDRSRVVFAARTKDPGPIGTAKATLYIAPFDNLTAYKPILELDSGGLLGSGWSFDGNWIAFLATIDGARGLHVINANTAEVRLIEKGSFHPTASSWSPTDLRIALLDKTEYSRTVRIFDLRDALAPK